MHLPDPVAQMTPPHILIPYTPFGWWKSQGLIQFPFPLLLLLSHYYSYLLDCILYDWRYSRVCNRHCIACTPHQLCMKSNPLCSPSKPHLHLSSHRSLCICHCCTICSQSAVQPMLLASSAKCKVSWPSLSSWNFRIFYKIECSIGYMRGIGIYMDIHGLYMDRYVINYIQSGWGAYYIYRMRPKSKSKPKKKILPKSIKLPPKHSNSLASRQQLITSGNLLFDRKEILDKQQKLTDNYEKCKKNNPSAITYYEKIKFQQQIYCCGDPIQFHALQQEPFVGKLTKIIQLPKEKELLPFIQVQWYMHKQDLPQKWTSSQYYHHMGSAQLFPSNYKLHLYVQSLKSKCVILTIEEYGQLGIISDGIYFSRSSLEGNQLHPDPSEWKSDCSCNMPTNPQLKYICCSQCERWFHQDCAMGGGQEGWECDQCAT